MNNTQSMKFQGALQQNNSFEAFIQYLSRELSIKFLLAFVEIIQLQQFIVEQKELKEIYSDRGAFICNEFRFYDDIVKSDIVYNGIAI